LLTVPPLYAEPVIFAETAVPGTIEYEAGSAKSKMLSGVTVYETGSVPEAYPVEALTVIVPLVDTPILPDTRPVDDIVRPCGMFSPPYETTERSLKDEAVIW
jgi:hypothetical protein